MRDTRDERWRKPDKIEDPQMLIEARIDNEHQRHAVELRTNGTHHSLSVAPRPNGRGSSANGGELLCLALATCYCNDIYREAARRKIEVNLVDVEVAGEFGGEGEPARNVYRFGSMVPRGSGPCGYATLSATGTSKWTSMPRRSVFWTSAT